MISCQLRNEVVLLLLQLQLQVQLILLQLIADIHFAVLTTGDIKQILQCFLILIIIAFPPTVELGYNSLVTKA